MNSIVRLAFVAAAALPTAAAAMAQQLPPSDAPGALPYDLAFGMASFIWDTQFAVSADGRFVAYDVRVPPADTTANLDERYQPNGTPSSVVGATIRYTDMASKRTIEVCPGGACWRPVWSPDGAAITFFSDADGLPQLWVHDVAEGTSRKLSEEPVKPKLWHGDEPRWSPDGSTLYVGFAPEGPFRNPMRPTEVRPENPAGVVVLRSGSEAVAAPEAETPPPTPMTDHYAREHLVAVKAVDVASGETRVLVPQDAEFPAGTLRRSASGRWLGYLSTFQPESDTTQSTVMDVAVVPTAGGEPIPVVRNVPLTRNDYFGVSYAWHPSDDRLVYLDGKRMHLLDLRSGSPATPVPLAPGLGDVAPTVFAFTRDGEAVVMGVDVVDDRGYGDPRPRAIAVVPLDGGMPTTFALADERWTYDQVLKADERTAWQPDGTSISVLVTERATGDKAILRFDRATDGAQVLWKARARLVNLTSGGSHDFIVGQYEDMRTPSNIFRFDADFSARERISHIDPRLDDVEVGTAEIFETTVPLHDGTLATVKTAVLLPPGATRGDRLPALVTMYPGSDITRRAADFGGGS
ncbi:MAG: hypothetical protein OXO53_12600, partial [Chloroflexota bacterium]|nr:hypothetical protein [Chloroflexota bacterium]